MPISVLGSLNDITKNCAPDAESASARLKVLSQIVHFTADFRRLPSTGPRNPARVIKRVQADGGAARDVRAADDGASGGAGTQGATLHRLKVTLQSVRPSIWRRLEIPSVSTLSLVSDVLIVSMGWSDMHPHAFKCGDVFYGAPDSVFSRGLRSERSATLEDERSATLEDVVPNVKDHFLFEYDFADEWYHKVVVEAIEPLGDAQLPRCIAGARACPPEDCGGPNGYSEILDILTDPTDGEYEETRDWIGDDFKPARFDLAETNLYLPELAPRRRAH